MMARDDYYVVAAKILKYLYECLKKDIPIDAELITAEALDVSPGYWEYIFRTLADSGYINGVIQKKLVGNPKPQVKVLYGSLEITPEGIAYLEENSSIQKALEILDKLKDFIPVLAGL